MNQVNGAQSGSNLLQIQTPQGQAIVKVNQGQSQGQGHQTQAKVTTATTVSKSTTVAPIPAIKSTSSATTEPKLSTTADNVKQAIPSMIYTPGPMKNTLTR